MKLGHRDLFVLCGLALWANVAGEAAGSAGADLVVGGCVSWLGVAYLEGVRDWRQRRRYEGRPGARE